MISSKVYFSVAAVSLVGIGIYLYLLTKSSNRLNKSGPLSGFVDWTASQKDKEIVARAWMERYVRNTLLKSS